MSPTLPTLDEMRALLRAAMTKAEFFAMLDELAERPGGLRFGAVSENLVSIPVAEGSDLLCFLVGDPPSLTYVEYQGGIFLEAASWPPESKA
ncbi:MAG: hypothetical protein ABIY55_14675 [Kofleriaceae bacterium]